jgi:hypothetical protein
VMVAWYWLDPFNHLILSGDRNQSLRGPRRYADFPRYHLAFSVASLSRDFGEGSTVISRYGLAVCSPDKEFRYLRTVRAVTTLTGGRIDYLLCMSPCRSDYLISLRSLAYSL